MRLIMLCGVLLLSACQTPIKAPPPQKLTTLFDYQLHDAKGQPMTLAEGAAKLAKADVIMVGELHGHQGVHRFQAELLAQLLTQDKPIALAMEQFSRDNQGILNSYLHGELGEDEFIKRSHAWPSYASDYRPLITLAKQQRLPVIAANAPRNIVRCIGQQGPDYLKQVSKAQRAWVANHLTLADDAYKARFMANRHHGKAPSEHQFAAQTTWDDTMAESIADFLERQPDHQVLLTVGRFHVAERLGTVQRLQQRQPDLNIAVIYPLMPEEDTPHADIWTLTVPKLPVARLKDEPLPDFSLSEPAC